MQWICYILTKTNQKPIAPLQKNNLYIFKKKKNKYSFDDFLYRLVPYVSLFFFFFFSIRVFLSS